MDFTIPFSGFASTTFINCFASVYMYLENMGWQAENMTYCNEWENGQCNGCGNCATKPQSRQERYFFLFDTMCGRSSLRCRFDSTPSEMEQLINSSGWNDDGGANDNKSDGLTTMWNAQRDRLAYQYRSLSDGDGSWYSMRGNVDYQRTSKKNKDRMITLSYKISTQPQNSDYYTDYKDIKDPFEMDIVKKFLLNNSHSDGKTNTTEHTFQVDYTTPIGKLHTIEAGAKYIIRNNLSDNKLFEAEGVSDNYEYNNDRSSKYKHLNDILAAYLGYTLRYKTFSFKPGVRYEYTSQDVKYLAGAIGPEADFSTSYNDFVPS